MAKLTTDPTGAIPESTRDALAEICEQHHWPAALYIHLLKWRPVDADVRLSFAKRLGQGDAEDCRTMLILTQLSKYQYWDDSSGFRVWVYEWSRDCDLMEGDSVASIPATLEAYNEFEAAQYDSAEGP